MNSFVEGVVEGTVKLLEAVVLKVAEGGVWVLMSGMADFAGD